MLTQHSNGWLTSTTLVHVRIPILKISCLKFHRLESSTVLSVQNLCTRAHGSQDWLVIYFTIGSQEWAMTVTIYCSFDSQINIYMLNTSPHSGNTIIQCSHACRGNPHFCCPMYSCTIFSERVKFLNILLLIVKYMYIHVVYRTWLLYL